MNNIYSDKTVVNSAGGRITKTYKSQFTELKDKFTTRHNIFVHPIDTWSSLLSICGSHHAIFRWGPRSAMIEIGMGKQFTSNTITVFTRVWLTHDVRCHPTAATKVTGLRLACSRLTVLRIYFDWRVAVWTHPPVTKSFPWCRLGCNANKIKPVL